MSFTVRSTAWNTTEYSWKWIYLQHESFITSFALFLLPEDFCHPGFWGNPLFLQLFCLLWWVLLPRSLMWVSPTFLLFTLTLSLHSPWLNPSVPTASTYLHSGNPQNYNSGPNLSLESGSLWPDLAPQLNTRQAGSLQPRVSQRVTCEASPSLPSVLPGNAPLQVLSCFLIHGCNHIPSLLPKWLWVAYREHTGLCALGKHVPSLRLGKAMLWLHCKTPRPPPVVHAPAFFLLTRVSNAWTAFFLSPLSSSKSSLGGTAQISHPSPMGLLGPMPSSWCLPVRCFCDSGWVPEQAAKCLALAPCAPHPSSPGPAWFLADSRCCSIRCKMSSFPLFLFSVQRPELGSNV